MGKTYAHVNSESQSAVTPVSSGLLQRQCRCGKSGNQVKSWDNLTRQPLTLQSQTRESSDEKEAPPILHDLPGLTMPIVQTKLIIGTPNDKYEQEADRIADQVIRMTEPQVPQRIKPKGKEKIQTKLISNVGLPIIQLKCAACEEEMLQPKLKIETLNHQHHTKATQRTDQVMQKPKTDAQQGMEATTVQSRIQTLKQANGMPLPLGVRTFMESRFGQDFSGVHLHTTGQAPKLASSLNARAFTVGNNIAFGSGEFQPHTVEGKKLLAHELTHVIQQSKTSKIEALATHLLQTKSNSQAKPAGPAEPAEPAEDRQERREQRQEDRVERKQGRQERRGQRQEDRAEQKQDRQEQRQERREQRQEDRAERKQDRQEQRQERREQRQEDRKQRRLQANVKKACLQPVVIADDDGKNPTTAPSMGAAQSIWKKCCIDYAVQPTQTVESTSFKVLDESKTDTPTKETSALFAMAGSSKCIQVFVPQTFQQDGKVGKSISGGGATYFAGTKKPRVVVVEGSVPEVVAHEVGHASGFLSHDSENTVMKPTGAFNIPNSSNVSAKVCRHSRRGRVLEKSSEDCAQSYT